MKTIPLARLVFASSLAVCPWLAPGASAQGGSLTPPGPPQPTMKTLLLIDPGTPIQQGDLPLTISLPGSYYLAENLSRDPSAGAAISVASANVTVDLRGFTIQATGGSGIAASQSAIHATAAAAANLTVKNGNIAGSWFAGVHASTSNVRCLDLTVSGAVNTGLLLGLQARASGCTVDGENTTATGISAGNNSVVRDCVAHRCTGPGFNLERGCVVTQCVSAQNEGVGFDISDHSVVANCTSRDNSLDGYDLGFGMSVHHSVAAENDRDGFEVTSDSILAHCASRNNALVGFDLDVGVSVSNCTSSSNQGDGFVAGTASIIRECISRNNGQGTSNTNADGFQLASRSILIGSFADNNEGIGINDDSGGTASIQDNSVWFNSGGGIDVSLSGALVTGNHVQFNTGFNIDQVGGDVGPVENASNGTSPNANFD